MIQTKRNSYTRDDVKGILFLQQYIGLLDFNLLPEDILEMFDEFNHSGYNLPNRPIVECIRAWVQAKLMNT